MRHQGASSRSPNRFAVLLSQGATERASIFYSDDRYCDYLGDGDPRQRAKAMSDERYHMICRRIHRGEELLGLVQRVARGRVTCSKFELTVLITDVQEWVRTLPTDPPTRPFRSRSQKQEELLERLLSFLDAELAALDVARHKETPPR